MNPIDLFASWFEEAVRAGVHEPEVMALATATPDGRPSLRFVLYRGLSGDGLRFFTNLESRKAGELLANGRAAAAFHWAPQKRQVRIEGAVERLGPEEDDAYFAARPRGHQLAAWASPQSRPIARAALEARYAELERQHAGKPVPRPPFWGGFRIVPDRIELWSNRDNRLHERTVYVREGGSWRQDVLAP
jgi:pyridoxamine 5'-phosphate oxidase